jgi:hypothetical protein
MKKTAGTEIKTRTLPDLPNIKQRVKTLSEYLFGLGMEDMKMLHALFLGEKPRGLKKQELITVLAAAMTFDNEKAFREWLFSLPVLTQNLLYILAFDYFVPVTRLENEFDISLVQEISEYSWKKTWAFHKELDLNFLDIFEQYGQVFVVLPRTIRKILKEWLAPPPELVLGNCIADSNSTNTPWDNSAGIADSLPLFCDAMKELFNHMKPPDSPYRCLRGFKKKDAENLRASSAFKSFDVPAPVTALPGAGVAGGKKRSTDGGKRRDAEKSLAIKASELVPDSVDLTARFILSMKNFSITRPQDGQNEAKALVDAFFGEKSQYKGYVNPPDRHTLEFNVLFDHVSKYSDYSLSYGGDLPHSRKIFQTVLMFCAKDGGTFDADKIAQYIYRTAKNFTFFSHDIEKYLKLKAETITADGITYSNSYYDEFYPQGIMTYYLLVTPLFKAYCYLFAALGILEITQTMPPLARLHKEKNLPLSPYDSLKTFRVTKFGKWCLGLTEKRPERPKVEYQAIADKELLLVTVQGTSLERTVYLDKIGRKLGQNRWRISPDSFIAGCVDKKQIEDRVAKFKALIDPGPAPHWLALFEKAVNRSGLFEKTLDDMLVYRFPTDLNIAEALLRDTEFRSLVHRAEGGLFVVPEKNRKKFFSVLNKHGIAVFNNN